MNIRRLALISTLIVPIAFLPAACAKDEGDGGGSGVIKTGTDTGTGTGTGTTPVGEGNGGVAKVDNKVLSNAAAAACNGESSEPESIHAKIQMVVDVSSSMTDTTRGSNKTKWEQTQTSIVAGFVGNGAGETGLPDSVAVGLLFYPNIQRDQETLRQEAPIEACVNTDAAIPMATLGADVPGSQRQLLRDALNGIVLGPQGTPTYDALYYGAAMVLNLSASVAGAPYIVLITDGTPTLEPGCKNSSGNIGAVDPQPIVDLIDELWRDYGVKTFLIGSPGSETEKSWMSAAAVLGQTARAGCNENGPNNWCHMDLTTSTDFGADLTAALKAIAGSVASCNYNIATEGMSGETVDPNMTVVLAKYSDGTVEMINRDDSPDDCTAGWYIDSESNQVMFCSETCNKVQSDSQVQLQVLFGCNENSVIEIQ